MAVGVNEPREETIFQVNLMYMNPDPASDYRNILCVIDSRTLVAWTTLLKDNRKSTVLEGLQLILTEFDLDPDVIEFDGSGFREAVSWATSQGIRMYKSRVTTLERFNLHLRRELGHNWFSEYPGLVCIHEPEDPIN